MINLGPHYPNVGPWFVACARGNPKGSQCGTATSDHLFAITGSTFSFAADVDGRATRAAAVSSSRWKTT